MVSIAPLLVASSARVAWRLRASSGSAVHTLRRPVRALRRRKSMWTVRIGARPEPSRRCNETPLSAARGSGARSARPIGRLKVVRRTLKRIAIVVSRRGSRARGRRTACPPAIDAELRMTNVSVSVLATPSAVAGHLPPSRSCACTGRAGPFRPGVPRAPSPLVPDGVRLKSIGGSLRGQRDSWFGGSGRCPDRAGLLVGRRSLDRSTPTVI